MKVVGKVYQAEGWTRWEGEVSPEIAQGIKNAAYARARQRADGPIAPTDEEWNLAGDDVMHIGDAGTLRHGNRYVDRIEFAPGEIHII